MNAIDRHGLQTLSPTFLALQHQTTTDTSVTNTKLNAESDQSPTESNASVSIDLLNHNPHSRIRQTEQNTAHSTDNTPSHQNTADNIEPTEDEKLWEDVNASQTKPKTRGTTKHHRPTEAHGLRRLKLQPVKMAETGKETNQQTHRSLQ